MSIGLFVRNQPAVHPPFRLDLKLSIKLRQQPPQLCRPRRRMRPLNKGAAARDTADECFTLRLQPAPLFRAAASWRPLLR
jgi:hypothetical protein